MNDSQSNRPPPDAPTAPVAARRPHAIKSPQGTRIDPYYWLRDDSRQDPDVLDYLKAENAYLERQMAGSKHLQERLYEEFIARLKQDDASVPHLRRGYWYYMRYAPEQEHPIFARRKAASTTGGAALDAARGAARRGSDGTLSGSDSALPGWPDAGPEEIMLDANERAAGHEFYQIAGIEVSPGSGLLAFCEDTVGRREYTLHFKNLETGEMLPDTIRGVESDMAWANDERTVLYVEKDPDTLLGLEVKRHTLGQDPALDALVFTQTDKSFYTGVSKSKSERFIFLYMESTVASEWWYAEAEDPALTLHRVVPARRDHEYQLEHVDQRFIIRTNAGALNFRLMQVPIERAHDESQWTELVPHREDTFLEDFAVFERFVALEVRAEGLKKIRIHPLGPLGETPANASAAANAPASVVTTTPLEAHFIASDEPAYAMSLSYTAELGTDRVRYAYHSLTTPTTIYEHDVRTGERHLLKREPVLGDFDPARYRTEYLFVAARDGRRIPVSLVYRVGFVPDGTAPLLQYGYGAYGLSLEPAFSSLRLSLLDRGFVFAIAHVRGGQEMGRAWYDEGRLLHKENSFNDFIDVTRELVARGYAARARVFAMGGSAGGLLVAAVANRAPGEYRAIVAQVPFVDVVTTMLDESVPLTTNEYDEWGDPRQKVFYDYMSSYSPYDNVRAQAYPALLVTTGLWDSQVQYYEPAKWVAKLRAMKTDCNALLLRTDLDAGHGGKSGRFQRYREIALEFAFVLSELEKDGARGKLNRGAESQTPRTPAARAALATRASMALKA